MAGNGIGQRQRQRVGEFTRARRPGRVAELRRRLQADQLVRRLAAVARLGRGAPHHRDGVGQYPPAARAHPVATQGRCA